MSTASRLLSIFEFFKADTPLLTAEDIISKLGCSRPQGYRYIRELNETGFLARFAGGYSLGPKIIELDFFIRASDPLLEVSVPLIRDLRNRVACDVTLVKMFGDHLVAIYHAKSTDSRLVGFRRGRPMPKFRGCGYNVILAHMPSARQKRLFDKYPEAVETSTLRHTWEGMRADLRNIRKMGYAVSLGELDPLNVGIAAPILDGELNTPPPALTLVVPRARYETSNKDLLAQIVKEVAADISHNLQLRRPKS